ncbi:MAG: protein jag [Oscillospiraceae bacterium]|nr:protein jag [Oscillospiraceae bacterium]
MTTRFIDVTGKTEDEAIGKALAQLGLDRDEVSVEILERAKKGFLGIGAAQAKVRVTYEVPEEPAAPVKPVMKPAAEKPAAPKPAPKPVEKREERPAPRQEEKPARSERPERRKPAPRPRPEQSRKAVKTEGEDAPIVPVDLGEPCNDGKAQQITAFLTGLLEHMGSEAQVKVYYSAEENRYKAILEGEKLGALIGRRGETLDAIQQLTNYSVNRGSDKRIRIHVDAENYRLKREQSLQHLARKVAAKVVKYKRNVTLEPMNAYERHVIHTALQDVPGVTTYSMGTEPNRRVIVAVDRGNAR